MAVVSPWLQALPLRGTRATPLFKVMDALNRLTFSMVRTSGKLGPRQVIMALIEWATRVLQRYDTIRCQGDNLRQSVNHIWVQIIACNSAM
jgi:hypothetical protein